MSGSPPSGSLTPIAPVPAAWRSLLDQLSVAVVVTDLDGTVVHANPTVTDISGWAPAEIIGRSVDTLLPERMHASRVAGFRRWAEDDEPRSDGAYLRVPAVGRDGREHHIGMVLSRVHAPDGTPLVLALIRPRDDGHEAVNAVALELVSVLAQEHRVEEAIPALLRAIGERLGWDVANLWVVDDERNVLRATAQWESGDGDHSAFQAATDDIEVPAGVGLPGRVWAYGRPASIPRLDEDEGFLRRVAAREAGLRTGFAFPVEHDGRIVGVIEMFRASDRPIERELPDVLADIGAHLGPYLDQLQRHERRRRAEERLRLLTTAIERLARWLDYPAPLDEVSSLLVPVVADACVIDLLEQGRLVRRGSAYATEAHRADVERLARIVSLDVVNAGPLAVAESGTTLAYGSVGADELVAGLPGEVPRDLAERLAPASTVVVPLIGRGATVGALTLARRGLPFDDDETRFAEELGRHLGLAVANAALFEREHAIAAALQQTLLPPSLPEVPGLQIAGRYEPGGSRLAVGGDFYDVFPAGPDAWYAIVGDVCGTGAEAAAITSQVRYTARALARRVGHPAELLGEINAALLDRHDTRFCTALVARIDQTGGEVDLTIASGGHPSPVHLARDGCHLVDAPGSLLGVYEDAVHTEVPLRLAPGESLALYTDGVIEARDDQGGFLGEQGLMEVLAACTEEDAENVASRLVLAAVEHSPTGPADDIAVLVVRAA